MGDLWRMTVADRRWWIAQTVDFMRQQNEAQNRPMKKPGSPNSSPQQDPNAIQSAREMLRNYHNISSSG